MVRLFANRVGGEGCCPNLSMNHLIAELRKSSKHKSLDTQLGDFLTKRRILRTEFVPGLTCDGYITPVGSSFQEGFRMALKRGTPQVRSRFTIAHELCHTFFYEIVPEMKFGSVEVDEEEERLCNVGAAELLIPAKSLRMQAKPLNVSIDSLEKLASRFVVSSEAMLLRLRSLKLWDCELSFWRPRPDGTFQMDRIAGGRKVNWVWSDAAPLNRAWNDRIKPTGRAYLELRDSAGRIQLRLVCYQLARRGDALVSLWSAKPIDQRRESLPLFQDPIQSLQIE
jgi:hypothetical protein